MSALLDAPPEPRAGAVMTVNESDASGAGGLQADVRAMAAVGVHPLTVVTRVAVRCGPMGVRQLPMPTEAVLTQWTELWEGIGADALKIGALGSTPTAEILWKRLSELRRKAPQVSRVIAPRLFDKQGRRCTFEGIEEHVRRRYVGQATVVVVNVFEAEALTGQRAMDMGGRRDALRALVDMGAGAALIFSSQNDRHAVDLACDGSVVVELGADRLDTERHQGAGDTFSAAVASHLARGVGVMDALDRAKGMVHQAIARAPRIGVVGRDAGAANPLAGLYRSAGLEFATIFDPETEQGEG